MSDKWILNIFECLKTIMVRSIGEPKRTKENYKKFLKLVNEIDSKVFKDIWVEENAILPPPKPRSEARRLIL